MAPKIGLGGAWSLAPETTVGTFVAPTRSLGVDSVTYTPNFQYDDEAQLVSGIYAGRVEDTILTAIDATASINGKVKAAKFGAVFNTLTGATVTPTGTTAKTYVFPFGLSKPSGATAKALSSQFRFDDGTSVSFRGGQTTSFKLSAAKGASLKFELAQYGMEAQMGTGAPATASPVYTASEGFSFINSALTFAGGSIGSCVSAFEANFEIPRATGEQCLNGSAYPLEAFVNDTMKLSGTFTAKWDSDAQIDAFRASTWRTLKLENKTKSDLAGASGTKGECTLDIANFLITGAPINVGGPGALEIQFPWEAKVAGANPLGQLTYVTLDAAL